MSVTVDDARACGLSARGVLASQPAVPYWQAVFDAMDSSPWREV